MAKGRDNDNVKGEPVPSGKVLPRDIVPEMKDSYLDYAMSVIVARALPDVRDGLKPVHRRILFTCHEMGLTHGSKFRKSAAVVGSVMMNYHPHGDTAIYDTLAKMAQDFSYRYPLVAGQGNFGSVDGDAPAAMRYTEAKLARISSEILLDIEKETVDFRPNYDNTRKEPIVFPTRVPNLLLNGTLGIAVGMATKIPPHNLGEVSDALMLLAENEDATMEDLLEIIQGPDFPTGGIVFNAQDIKHAYATGRGGVVCRGEAEIVESKKGNAEIVISSIPYQVNRAELIIKIADLVREKKLDGIRDIRDESTKDTRIVIELKGGGHPQKVLNALYKHTDLETMFHFNMLALSGGVPRLLSLKEILALFIEHRKEVIVRRTKFLLKEAEARAHILEGLSKALDHIDAVIKTIKSSKDVATAHANLKTKFKFSDLQATAILDMRLQKLAGLERKKIEDELHETRIRIKEYKEILASPKKVTGIFVEETKTIKKNFADERKTKIIKGGVKNISVEDLVPDVENIVTLTAGGYIKRTDPGEYRKQRRGGSGVIDLETKEEDFVSTCLSGSAHSDLLFFTDRGKVYQIKMYDLPEGKRATRGKSIANFLSIEGDEKITSVLAVPKGTKEKTTALILVTEGGVVKKVSGKSFADVRRSGIIAIKLTKGDKLLSAKLVTKGDSVILVTKKGQSIRFRESDVREMGRAAGGVRAIRLSSGDRLVGADVASGDEGTFFVMSAQGFGKRTSVKEYRLQKRGGSGIKTSKVSPKTGELIGGRVLSEEGELLAISKQGQIIRVSAQEIPILGRQTQGVRVMKVKEKDALASFTLL